MIGGHFAPLAPAIACGGKAARGLGFLNEEDYAKNDQASPEVEELVGSGEL